MKIKITSKSGILPAYETEGSAGMDLRAYLDEPVVIQPGKRYLVPTGISIELPRGYEAQVRARSGLAVKHGIGLVNGIGTIDSDYRGEIKVGVVNLSDAPYTFHSGDRVAQLCILPVCLAEFCEAQLDETQRGAGGFGSSGK